MTLDLAALRFDDHGLLPVVAQDASTGAVLMLAWATREAVERTLGTGEAHFWSRSRQALWRKGETSGNTLRVVAAVPDCDGDALLLAVEPAGPACHRGTTTCFEPNPLSTRLDLGWLWQVLEQRKTTAPEASYTARLLAAGTQRIAQKVGEEAVEMALAAVAGEASHEALIGEAADLLYHLLVLLLDRGVDPGEIAAELRRRHTARAGAR